MSDNQQATRVAVINFPAVWDRCNLENFKQKMLQQWEEDAEFITLTANLVSAQQALASYKRSIGNAPLFVVTGLAGAWKTNEGKQVQALEESVNYHNSLRANGHRQKAESINQKVLAELKALIVKYAKSQNISIILNHTDTFFYVSDLLDITDAIVAIYKA